ncbi:glycosyltransferase [Paenibacillus aceris]|uniref:Glycosyltransferase involved in cell wall biosynthesis n=1 Tax=Paenibacillus aceris TaxID=869555 RepID=A0ABS4I7Y9_9BACL|nr:glycosyltransferase involved in cell wall biosynthesis [Paenibacillus aceris]NHW39339.1 glycosyltransferase family 4 protein [Paenibacillus aceris]
MNILLDGKFYNGHGLAEGNRILLRILDKAGYRVRILARDTAEKHKVLPSDEVNYISTFENTQLSSNDIYMYNWVGSHVRYQADFRVNIARTTFETDRIPDSWVSELNKFNEVWVQSTFNQQTFTSSGVTAPIRLIPNFFDLNEFAPQGPLLPYAFPPSFKFLSVFDLKKRKGYDVLLNAYLNEFSKDDHVALVVKIRDSSKSEKIEQFIADHPKPRKDRPAIYIVDHMLQMEDILKLYRLCDAFVLPTRGEGWGRPFFEAMLMEMPVIGTNWSGHTEFMDEDNSYLVKVKRLVRIENAEDELFNGHYWAEPSLKDLQRKMRYVYEHPEEAKAIGRKARNDLLTRYNLQEVARSVVREMDKYQHLFK